MDNKARPMHLLVVEDNESHANLLRVLLEMTNEQCSITHVTDGIHALDFLNKRGAHRDALRPDLILLDLRLPRMNGHEFLKVVKGDPHFRSIPVIVLSTSSAQSDRQQALELHANSYVTKPMLFEQIQEMITALINYWGVWDRPCVEPDPESKGAPNAVAPMQETRSERPGQDSNLGPAV